MLELRDLAAVRSHTVLFRRLNLLLHAGEALRVAGPNGAGKTTLLRILCGLTEPVRGVVCWDGTPIRDLGDDYRARLGFLGHQEGHFGDLTARENLALAGAPVTAATVMTVLERVGLSALANQPARLLSQGQRRRLGLGRLLLRPTTLWVLDEPLTGLDRQGVELVSHLLAEHLAGGGLAVLTTHQDLPGLGGVMRELDLGAQA
ncbi:cytochrome c biogenesis heme-transporting ATPase CcmA [Immundisolibacter sp.]|uniref:cytochrome c biogenesis heme-transporting ATPase CcmA n=1 Tax=Immundisolibacter sp. TaxID=1934948 RepID=UPI002619EB92|nr:cytochrome c biogenesis heme-transporting ATPase CcmA [Immundisolibacter sp.]MDD3651608.1 cytochrome c biogenesis heme-transporting ATPase CcmA [Immundisolibacter sp.]